MTTFDQDRYAIVDYDSVVKLIRLKWLSETIAMPVTVFKDTLAIVADLALEREVEKLLIDVRDLQSDAYVETDTWLRDNIVPRFNLTLKRVAWVSRRRKRTLPGKGEPFSNPGELFQNCWFPEEGEALRWVSEVPQRKR